MYAGRKDNKELKVADTKLYAHHAKNDYYFIFCVWQDIRGIEKYILPIW